MVNDIVHVRVRATNSVKGSHEEGCALGLLDRRAQKGESAAVRRPVTHLQALFSNANLGLTNASAF